MFVNTCLPLNCRNGFRSAFFALNAISPSSFIVRIESTPRKNIPMDLKNSVTQLPLRSFCFGLGLEEGDGEAFFGGASLPSRAAGRWIFESTSPSSQDSVGRKAKSNPKPSLIEWWTRITTADRPTLARSVVTCQSGWSCESGRLMFFCTYSSMPTLSWTSFSTKWYSLFIGRPVGTKASFCTMLLNLYNGQMWVSNTSIKVCWAGAVSKNIVAVTIAGGICMSFAYKP
mmetsp:Transcript_78382/g.227496  ORF Transcript_78382/g.227496 Transcript_78382/m.227496 type:complete len:229 (+) Transcript_78382:774-1460(+)